MAWYEACRISSVLKVQLRGCSGLRATSRAMSPQGESLIPSSYRVVRSMINEKGVRWHLSP